MDRIDVWVTAVGGGPVCEACGFLHGSVWPAGVGPTAPLHANCRCRRRPLIPSRMDPAQRIRAGLRARTNARDRVRVGAVVERLLGAPWRPPVPLGADEPRSTPPTLAADVTDRPATVSVEVLDAIGALGWDFG